MNAPVFVDANVFLRFFTVDESGQSARAERLFKAAAAGECRLVTGPPVFFEVAWTLRRRYGVSPENTIKALSSMLALPGLFVTDAGTVESALSVAIRSGVEFADAYIAASARIAGCESVATFNGWVATLPISDNGLHRGPLRANMAACSGP